MKALKLGKMTLGSIFKEPETVCYPAQTKPAPEGMRGTVECVIGDCVFCSMCARCCPADAIEVDRDESTWSVNPYQCVQCASCVDNCPQDCLFMSVNPPQVATKIKAVVLTGEQ